MDEFARAFYEIAFELAYIKKRGNEFQDFFSTLMEKCHPNETIVGLPRLLVLSVLLTFKIFEACADFLMPDELGSCRKRRDFGARGSLVRQAVAARPRWVLQI